MKKKIIKILPIIAILAIIQSVPIFALKNIGMDKLETENAYIYYDRGNLTSAEMIRDKLDDTIEDIRFKLGYEDGEKATIYVYEKQSSLHIRKLGFITLLIAPDWYIGDNKGQIALIVSPFAEVNGHSQESILSALPHEIVHTYNYQTNPKLSYFIDNGVASYLSNQRPTNDFRVGRDAFPIENLAVENQVRFGNMGGYAYSYTYIEFLDKTYGWSSIRELISGAKSYEQIFGKNDTQIYSEWMQFLDTEYPTHK